MLLKAKVLVNISVFTVTCRIFCRSFVLSFSLLFLFQEQVAMFTKLNQLSAGT